MKKYSIILGVVVLSVFMAGVASANHSWGGYHWARTVNPLSLKLGDAVNTAAWDASLSLASLDWSLSKVLDTNAVTSLVNPKTCRPTNGRVEVCNSKYGNNGWLGIAQIWITGGEHIAQGTVKLNDTYFGTKTYNKPEWRNFVVCQEIGHIFGLDHQDEDFANANLETCMDYTSSPSTNQHPNQHDYDQLETIYAHLDAVNTAKNSVSSARARDLDVADRADWGKEVRKDKKGNASVYKRELQGGEKVFTFVIWADPSALVEENH